MPDGPNEKPAPLDAPGSEPPSLGLLVAVLGEDATFLLASGPHDREMFDALIPRRSAAYRAAARGAPQARMLTAFDAWVIDMVRAMAPLSPPGWIPMMEVIREKVTLEIGARGLRSLFSSKPSDRDVVRVQRYGALAVRALRAVYASDGPLDAEEQTTVAAVVAALGLPDDEAKALLGEAPHAPETLDVYGEIEHAVARGIVRGAWLAAAGDGIDPREEQTIRVVAQKTGVPEDEVETARRESLERVEARHRLGAAAVDAVRYMVEGTRPEHAVPTAALVGALTVPRRWRAEVLAPVGQAAPVILARRHTALLASERASALGIAWAAALLEDPPLSRRALLQVRWERLAADFGDEDPHPRQLVERWIGDALANMTRTWT